MTLNARGQIWSLDVVLAAVVFTLALGLVLSQSELHLFYDQQDTHSRELWNATLFSSNMLVSKPDASVLVGVQTQNARCGPSVWVKDNDLSWMENCFVNLTATPSTSFLGVPPSYSIALKGISGLTGWPIPPTNPTYYSLSRTLLLVPSSASAKDYRQCLDGACPFSSVPITLTSWGSS